MSKSSTGLKFAPHLIVILLLSMIVQEDSMKITELVILVISKVLVYESNMYSTLILEKYLLVFLVPNLLSNLLYLIPQLRSANR
jgi:hypothetical protein